jgi:hypothetical protein
VQFQDGKESENAMSYPQYQVGDVVLINAALSWANVTAIHDGGRYTVRLADGYEVSRHQRELSGTPGDKTRARALSR